METRLKQLRMEKNLEQRNIADFLGISEHQYRRYEVYPKDIPLTTMYALADFYRVTIDYLVGRSHGR